MQNFPLRTRSDVVLGILGLSSIHLYVEQCKLRFFGALCNIKTNCTSKQLFLLRLHQKHLGVNNAKKGFINDIWDSLHKYHFHDILLDFLNTGKYPSKLSWKYLVKNVLLCQESDEWRLRLDSSVEFRRFKIIHPDMVPAVIWSFSKRYPNFNRTCKTVAKMWIVPPTCELLCALCKGTFQDAVAHCLLDCKEPVLESLRDNLLTGFVDKYPVNVYVSFDQADRDVQIATLLGALSEDIYESFFDDSCLFTSFIKDCLIFSEKAYNMTFQ